MAAVPFRPPPGLAVPDPRFDPYRERAGVLSTVGVLYLRLDTCWTQLGGHLWWRRWSEPREQMAGFIATTSGGFDDFVQDAETLAGELDLWGRGLFLYRGETVDVTWLGDAESRRVRHETFGLD